MDQAWVQRWSASRDGVLDADAIARIGLSRTEVRTLRRRGWTRPHPGVLVDPAVRATDRQALRVAVAAAGPGAMASHRSAAWLLGLFDRAPATPHVLVPHNRHPRFPEAVIHRTTKLPLPHHRHNLPLTDADSTLIDLAAIGALTEQALDRALADGLTTVDRLEAATRPDDHTRRRGVVGLRALLEEQGRINVPTPSVLELRMGCILEGLHRRHGLPRATAELAWEGGRYRLDYAWPGLLLAVEADGYTWHGHPGAKTGDEARRRELAMAGWLVLPYSWTEVVRRADAVGNEVLAAYKQRQPTSRIAD